MSTRMTGLWMQSVHSNVKLFDPRQLGPSPHLQYSMSTGLVERRGQAARHYIEQERGCGGSGTRIGTEIGTRTEIERGTKIGTNSEIKIGTKIGTEVGTNLGIKIGTRKSFPPSHSTSRPCGPRANRKNIDIVPSFQVWFVGVSTHRHLAYDFSFFSGRFRGRTV